MTETALAATTDTSWEVAGRFLDALVRRDFDALLECLDPHLRFRALLPPGPLELDTAIATVGRFRLWFDGKHPFEVVDASVGQVGDRLYLRWRIRSHRADDPTTICLVEQHAFADIADRIVALDLLCSGFRPEES